jgi:hypothetical protein
MIDPRAVHELLSSSLSGIENKGAKVEGIMRTYMIDIDKLEKDRMVVKQWLTQLPTEFLKEGGGGWSFLQLCQLSSGEQWGEQMDGDALFVLASALGLAKFLMPRTFWAAMPGGVPYMIFTLEDHI